MGVVEELQQCISRYEFDRAFVDVLGWSRFKHVSRQELPDVGRIPRGWKTKKTRARLDAAPRIPFLVRGVATLSPQVVLHCTSERGTYIDGLQRDRLSRELSKLFYRPIIIFSSVEVRCQDWYFPVRTDNGLSVVKFSADGPEAAKRLARALSGLELSVENLQVLDDHLEVFRRVSVVREELSDEDERDEELSFAMKFARFGDWAFEGAKKAYRARVRDVPQQMEIGRRAKGGDPEAIQRFFDMHLYLVYERAREYLKNKHALISEFQDYVGAGNLGVARGFARYDPTRSYAPSTLIFFHIDRQISRVFGVMEMPMWVPVHVQDHLVKACWRERTAFDRLAFLNQKEPEDSEVLESLELDEDDAEVYCRFKMARLWMNRVDWEEPDEFNWIPQLTYFDPGSYTLSDLGIEALIRLHLLPPKHLMAVSFRIGLDSDELSLEEVGSLIGTTRERARQIIKRGVEIASSAELDSGFDPQGISLDWREKVGRARGERVQMPAPPSTATRANSYVDFLMGQLGSTVSPVEILQTVRRYFPQTSLQLERIERKYQVRGWEYESALICDDGVESPLPYALQIPEPTSCGQTDEQATVEDVSIPGPPSGIRKANAYIEHVLDTFGNLYSPELLFEAKSMHFPESIITLDMIRDKFSRRGWNPVQTSSK